MQTFMYKNNVFTNIKIKNKSKKKQKCKGNAGMTASLHPFRPLSARLDAHVKEKCGPLDRASQSAAGLTAVEVQGWLDFTCKL